MKYWKYLKEIFITLLVISITWIWYASISTVSTWTPLTATLWNDMKDVVDINTNKLLNISSSWSNVWIWISNPQANLDVNWSIKIWWRKISKITVCTYSSTSAPTSGWWSSYYRFWTWSDCDNGLPSGTCIWYLSKAVAAGTDTDWEVLVPGEASSWQQWEWAAPNWGVHFALVSPWSTYKIQAIYFCQ